MTNADYRTCDVEGCQRKHEARGMCHKHYEMQRRKERRVADPEYRERLATYHREYAREWRARGIGGRTANLDAVGWSCELCDARLTESSAHMDHDHACCPRGKYCPHCFRGVLCNQCNTGLGALGDTPERLERALAYVVERSIRTRQNPRSEVLGLIPKT